MAKRAGKPDYSKRLQRAMERLEMSAYVLHKHVYRITDGARGSSYSAFRQYVSGKIIRPREDILTVAAECLRIRAEWLIRGDGPMTLAEETLEESQAQARIAAKALHDEAARATRLQIAAQTDARMARNRRHGIASFRNAIDLGTNLETWARHGIRQNVDKLPILSVMAITEFVSSVYTTLGPSAFGADYEGEWSPEDARGELAVSEEQVVSYAAGLTRSLGGLNETVEDWHKAAAVHSLLGVLYLVEFSG